MRDCVCVGKSIVPHGCEFPSLCNRTETHVEMYWGSMGGVGENLVSRSQFLGSLRNDSLLDYFSLTAAKLNDSNVATRLQSGNHMFTRAPVS